MKLIIPEKNAHWYTSKGQPMYEVKAKSREGMKAVTLREARELGLFPSVTTILQIIAKPALEAWKIEQGIMAALTLPRDAGEGMDAFAHRVVEDMEEQVSTAADFGRKIHHGIERLLQSDTEIEPEIMPWMDQVMKWLESNVESVIGAEQIIVSDLGYAGRLDLFCRLKNGRLAIVDFKTQKPKNGKVVWYDEWVWQLVAYAKAVREPNGPVPDLISVIIDSSTPSPVQSKTWEENPAYWKCFLAAFDIWKFLKNYDPKAS